MRPSAAPDGPGGGPDFLPVYGPLPASATVFSCPLCGARFTHGAEVCGTCPLSGGCDVVRCPQCRFAFPRSSSLLTWGRKLLRRLRGKGGPS